MAKGYIFHLQCGHGNDSGLWSLFNVRTFLFSCAYRYVNNIGKKTKTIPKKCSKTRKNRNYKHQDKGEICSEFPLQWSPFFFLESASTTSLLSHKLSTQWVSTWVMILMTDVEVNCNNLIVILMIIELCQKFNSIQQNYTKLNYFFKKYFSKFLKKREVKSLTSHLRIKLISIEQAIARVYLN